MHLRLIFQRLKEHGLLLNASKCIFGASEFDFLGSRVSSEGATPMTKRVEAILNYGKLKTISDLRRFLGAVNFYRRSLPKAAETQAPLNALLQGSTKNDKREISWTSELEKAFEQIKFSLANATLLTHPASAPLRITSNASDTAMGAVLEQLINGTWKPLGFFSKKFSSAQRQYSAYDRELTAIYEGIKYFRHMIEGSNFSIRTDHKPLKFAFKQRSNKASPHQARQLDFIAQFCTDISHIAGPENVVADTLLRVDAFRLPTSIELNELSNE